MNNRWLRILPLPFRRSIETRGYAQKVIKNSAWLLLERSLRHVIGFIVGIWIARYLGAEQFGLLAYATALVAVLAWLSVLGLDPAVVRDLVTGPSKRDEVLGNLLALRLLGAVVLLAAMIALVSLIDFADPRVPKLVLLIAWAQMPLTLDSLDCWFQAQQATAQTAAARMLALGFLTCIRFLLIWSGAPVEAFAWAILLEGMAVAIALLVSYWRAGNDLRNLRPRLSSLRAMLAESWPLVAMTATVAVYQRVDQVLIGEIAGYAAVGNYSVAVRLVEVSYLLPTVVLLTVFPALLIAHNSDPNLFRRRVQALFDIGLWLALATSILLWMVGGTLIRVLYGAAFAEATAVMNVVAWLPVFAITGMVRMRVLMAQSAIRPALALEALICALSIAGNLVLIPHLGLAGAAVAAIAAMGLGPLIATPFSRSVRDCNVALLRAVNAPWRTFSDQTLRR